VNISSHELAAISPFYLVFGHNLEVRECGPALQKLLPDLASGHHLTQHFRQIRPGGNIDFEALRKRTGALTVLETQPARVALRGQCIFLEESDSIVFVATPAVTNGEELKTHGLSFADFAAHDPIFEYLFLLQTVQGALQESRELAEQRAFLSEASSQLASSLDVSTVLARGVRQIVPRIAEGAFLWFQAAEGPGLAASFHSDPEKASRLARLEARLGALLSGGEVELRKSLDLAGFASHLRRPLQSRDRSLGTLVLLSAEPGKRYDPKITALVDDLVLRIAASLDNAQLYLDSLRSVRQRDEFLAIASHELRTPLTSLSMQMQVVSRLVENDRLKDMPRHKLSQMLYHEKRELDRFTSLVQNLVDVSRIAVGGLRLKLASPPLKLSDLVERVLQRLHSYLSTAGYEVVRDLDNSIEGRWDESRIEQVVTNLLTNAIRYGRSRPITVRSWKAGLVANLTVADEGVGIDLVNQKRIFERFERASEVNEHGGFGLGLYITKEIVAAHGGEISVTSEPNKGSTFQVCLPVSAD
jgi:signal transduction histidine kinase